MKGKVVIGSYRKNGSGAGYVRRIEDALKDLPGEILFAHVHALEGRYL